MQIGMTLWQLQYGDGQPGRWHDMWLHFEKFDDFITPIGKGKWKEKDDDLYLKFPWDEQFLKVQLMPNAGMMMTTFQPGEFFAHILKREQGTPAWGFLMLWNLLKRHVDPFSADESNLDSATVNALRPQLQRLAFKFDLLMSSLQTATTSISAKEQKWFIEKHSFSNQEVLKQLSELQVKLSEGLIKLVDELSTVTSSHGSLFADILDRLKTTYTFHTVQIRRAAYMRDPTLGDQLDAGVLVSGVGAVAKALSK